MQEKKNPTKNFVCERERVREREREREPSYCGGKQIYSRGCE